MAHNAQRTFRLLQPGDKLLRAHNARAADAVIALLKMLTASMLSLIFLFAPAPHQPALAEEAEWKLVQHHFERGEATVYITHDAVKIVKENLEILCKAPDWTVYCYNSHDKTVWFGKLEHFNGIALTSPWAVPKAKVVTLTPLPATTRHGMKVSTTTEGGKDRYYSSDEIKIAPQGAHFLCRYYYVPETDKVPLDFTVLVKNAEERISKKEFPWMDLDMRANKNGLRAHLLTNSVTRMAYDPKMFAVPVGYKRISDITRVAYSKTQQGQMADFMEDFGPASSITGSHSKSKKP